MSAAIRILCDHCGKAIGVGELRLLGIMFGDVAVVVYRLHEACRSEFKDNLYPISIVVLDEGKWVDYSRPSP